MAKLIYTRLQDHPRETDFATSGSLIVGRIDCISTGPGAAEQWMWGMQLDIGATPFRRGATAPYGSERRGSGPRVPQKVHGMFRPDGHEPKRKKARHLPEQGRALS